MKILNYALILSVMIWPAYPSLALATDTNTNTNTDTNCVNSDKTYGNGSFSHCVKNDTQENSQEDTTDLNNSGSQQSMMLGMMATAAGAGMVAAGMASTPPNGALIGAGTALIVMGMQGIQAAGIMANNAGISDWNDYKTGSVTPGSTYTHTNTVTGTDTPTDPGTPGGIDIDDNFTRTGKSGLVFDDFENKTGIGRDALTDGLKSGRSIADILAQSDKLKKKGFGADKIQSSMDGSGAAALSADEVMNKLGLTPEDLAAMANKNSSMGDDSAYAAGGGSGGSRTPASSSAATTSGGGGIDGMFGAGGANAAGSTLEGLTGAAGALSSDVQNALNRNGITDLSIFQMVHRQYKTKTPMMFGESSRKPSSTAENPFSNLGVGGKIEF